MFMQSRVPLGPSKFHIVVLVLLGETDVLATCLFSNGLFTAGQSSDTKMPYLAISYAPGQNKEKLKFLLSVELHITCFTT